ncbi:MAG: AAA family ATPase, partial [Nostoc sp.]|uniref:AAA family ATPase n=1 Tax=Nostoc sp. TaxID=1180 RepID=UPI002FF91A98
ELAGSTVREWLLNGLIPKSTTILLASDGGVGKTKFAYAIGKILIQGTQLGSFVTTGKRKILYYQGDESPGDMLQALDSLGYSEEDIGDSVRVRFGWSAENMPTLIQDLKEFQPEIVFIDSLSTANRFSIYRESEMEYARPILEMTGLANQYKTTFVIIHHMNKGGEVRGTTAIRNAVSEVWTLSKDNKETATAYDRILEIDKSRSRSCNKKYRMYFNPEDLSFTFLGEEGEEFGGPAHSAKESTLQFLANNRNIKFTGEEIAHRLDISKDYTRRFLNELSADGLIGVKRHPGKANTYFLTFEGGSPKDHPSDHLTLHSVSVDGNSLQANSELGIKKVGSPPDHLYDHPIKADTARDTSEGDPGSGENSKKNPNAKISEDKGGVKDHLCLKALSVNHFGGDPGGNPSTDLGVILHENILDKEMVAKPLPDNNPGSFYQGDPKGDPSNSQDHLDSNNPSPLKQADFEEKGIYWSPRLNNQVMIWKLFKSLPEAEVYQAGNPTDKIRVKLSELYPLPEFKINDEVAVIGDHKKFNDRVFTISAIHPGGIWIEGKTRTGTDSYGPFSPSQLRKVSG